MVFPPLCSVSRRPIWARTRSDNLLVGPGTPRGRTPTVGAPGRGLLCVDGDNGCVLVRQVLLPSPRDGDNGGRQPARRRRTRRRLPPMAEEQHPGLSCHLPRRRRRRRGNHGQAGGGTSSAVERVDDTGAPAGDTSGVDLAPETKTSAVSPQHANPKRTDDASTLAKDLLGVSLVPEITVQSVPNAISSPSIDQEVPSVFHPGPFRFSFNPPSDPASVDAFIKAYPNLPGYHMWSTWDRLTAVSTYGPPGSEEDDDPDSGWVSSGSMLLVPCETS
jgi:hypothetical protein